MAMVLLSCRKQQQKNYDFDKPTIWSYISMVCRWFPERAGSSKRWLPCPFFFKMTVRFDDSCSSFSKKTFSSLTWQGGVTTVQVTNSSRGNITSERDWDIGWKGIGRFTLKNCRSIVGIESLRTPISQSLCQDNGANKRSFNDGYHAIHHLNAGKCSGWSEVKIWKGKHADLHTEFAKGYQPHPFFGQLFGKLTLLKSSCKDVFQESFIQVKLRHCILQSYNMKHMQ